MDRQHQIILDMSRIIEAIDTFWYNGTSDEIILKRIYHLAKFELAEAQKQIDMKLDEMEEFYNGS